MPITQLTTRQIGPASVTRDDLDTSTTTKALIAKVIAGIGITISSTGVDAGTGDVTLNVTTQGLTINNFTTSQTLVANSYNSFDATSGNLVATLPTAIGIAGQRIIVRKTDATNNLITMGSTLSQTINESTANTVILKKNGWSFEFLSDGANWKII